MTTITNNKITLTDKTSAPAVVGELVRNGNNLYYYDGTTVTQLDATGGVSTLNDVGNVTITSNSSGEIIKWNGSAWVNNTLSEAGISATGHTHTASDTTDFDTEVSNNSSVTANTAKTSNATHTGDVTGSTALTIASNKITKSMIQTSAKTEALIFAVSDETTALTAGTSAGVFRMPYGFTLTAVRASVTTAGTGSVITVDINESATTILSTKLTIDATEKTSTTAATAAVISDSALADDSEITIDIDTVDSGGVGAGLKIYLIGYQT